MKQEKNPDKRRIFIKQDGNYYQLFSFNQEKDGSIYANWPNFSNTQWLGFAIENGQPKLYIGELLKKDSGKLSTHPDGRSHFRINSDPKSHQMIIKGNYLLDLRNQEAGARHLFTAFMQKPEFLPTSPMFNRQSDYAIESKEEINPFILIFFAVPHSKEALQIEMEFSLHIDEMDNIPGDFLGMSSFSLRYHDLFWFAYRTKHLNHWPKSTHISYHDGYDIPVFIGQGEGQLKVEYRKPEYTLEGNKFKIKANRPDSENI